MDLSGPLIHCPCYRSPADLTICSNEEQSTASEEDETRQLSLTDPRTQYSLFPLEDLYFCDDCNVHRCPRCVMEEIVSTFCPSCLFEFPSRANSSDSHCPRNCFRCPRCQAPMQTLGSEEAGYKLICAYCHWDSAKAKLRLTKATGLASQIQAQRSNSSIKYFDQARTLIENSQNSSKLRYESESARVLRQYRAAMGSPAPIDPNASCDSTLLEADSSSEISALLKRPTLDLLTSPAQRRLQSFSDSVLMIDMLPLPTPLRTKRTKRCRQCRYLLVKPDPKPLSINFRSRRYANRVLPTIQFTPLNSRVLIPHLTSQWKLKISNPLSEQCTFSLATASRTFDGDQIVILCPELTVGPTSEVWEESTSAPRTNSSKGELFEVGRNYASVLLEIVPSPRKGEEVEAKESTGRATATPEIRARFALFVQMHYLVELELENTSDGTSVLHKGNKVARDIGFWIVLDTAQPKRT